MYDDEAYLVPNELDRYAVGDRTSFTYAPDGSLTIYMQHENPGPEKRPTGYPPQRASSDSLCGSASLTNESSIGTGYRQPFRNSPNRGPFSEGAIR
jgi:hypothetical protein